MRIAYFTNGMASTLNSSLELSRRLTNAGHEVVYLSPANIGEQLSEYGYRFIRLTADDFPGDRLPEPVSITRPIAWFRALFCRRKNFNNLVEHNEVERMIEEVEPDVLLIDYEMHRVIISSQSTSIPTFLPIVWFTIYRHLNLPPMHTNLPASETPLVLLRIWYAWYVEWLRRHLGAWKGRFKRVITGNVYRQVCYESRDYFELLALARRKGFSSRKRMSSFHWLKPFVYPELPILVYNSFEMELHHLPRKGVHYTGPMVLKNRTESKTDPEMRHAVDHFLRDRQTNRPLVYCSLGTYWSADTDLLKRIIEVFRVRLDWDLILGMGGKLKPNELGATPKNVLVIAYAPQVEILQQSDCAITHGGITTINECIEFGVPIVVYSTGHVDQNGCAVRVAHHNLGVVADRKKDKPVDIEANIEKTLTDRVIKRNVEAMRKVFASYKAPDIAVATVEKTRWAHRC